MFAVVIDAYDDEVDGNVLVSVLLLPVLLLMLLFWMLLFVVVVVAVALVALAYYRCRRPSGCRCFFLL